MLGDHQTFPCLNNWLTRLIITYDRYTPPLMQMQNVVDKYFDVHDAYAEIEFGIWSSFQK